MEETENFIPHLNEHFQESKYTLWAAELKGSNNKLIGYIGLSKADFNDRLKPDVDIGFLIDNQYQNIGLATEGAKACLEYGFNYLGLGKIIAYTPSTNLKSIRVLEKIGLKHDPDSDFAHPKLRTIHKLSRHVLYRLEAEEYRRRTH